MIFFVGPNVTRKTLLEAQFVVVVALRYGIIIWTWLA